MTSRLPDGIVVGFDEALAGRRAECDGGSVNGQGVGSREEFHGTLTGEYWEIGTPPWRWYLMHKLTYKPPDFDDDGVWCEASFVFTVEG